MPENVPDDTDQDLIRRTLQGDRGSYGVLMGRYQRGLYLMIRGMVRNHDDANDLVQEAFFRAYKYLDRFQLERPFRPWLYRIGANLALHHIRHRKKAHWLSLEDENPDTGLRLMDAIADPGSEDAVREPVETRALAEAIEKVPPGFRAVLVLRAVEGLHYEEIAAVLGIPLGTVMSRLSRARSALREILENPAGADTDAGEPRRKP